MTPVSHGRSGRPWRRLRLQILERDGYRCQMRGPKCKGVATVVDHIVPLCFRPDLAHEPSNCRAACVPCNAQAGQQITSAKLRAKGQKPPPWVKRQPPPPFQRPNRDDPPTFRRPQW